MTSELPELRALNNPSSVVRIAYQQDVPLTRRIRRLIDTTEFQHLKGLSQLGLVSTVYPSANHTRFEHSLGVYHLGLRYLRHFLNFPSFRDVVTIHEMEIFVIAALLHDIGHWPYCHPIEDMQLLGIPTHESRATESICSGELANAIESDWDCTPAEVSAFLSGHPDSTSQRLLYSMLSSPVDIDKMDYLQRDSLHAGVPYGRNFDQQRLLSGLVPEVDSSHMAIRSKAFTAAEMMVFARYIMFSEVYWHKTVRAATAMLQRSIYETTLLRSIEPIFHAQDVEANAWLLGHCPAEKLVTDLLGPARNLHKCIFQCNASSHPLIFHRVAGMDYSELSTSSVRLQTELGFDASLGTILIDAPPKELEVQFDLNVVDDISGQLQPLSMRSPVVQSLATEQFDYHVKQVRIFVAPSAMARLEGQVSIEDRLVKAISN